MLTAERPLKAADVPDALFATDNELGIPALDLAFQAEYCELPVMTWGSVRRTTDMRGTWHFYTEDNRFSALWRDPSSVVNSGCIAVVEPNFTTSEQMAPAVAHYEIYRKRWLARYWQTQGIRIWVDLNVAPAWYDTNLLGVPRGWRAYMTRGYSDRLYYTQMEYELACEHRGDDDILFAVYGGGEAVRKWCQSCGHIWVPETADLLMKGKNFHG